MKVKKLVLLFCLLSVACKPYRLTFKGQMSDSYLYDFKMMYFKKLLLESFNRSEEIKKILISDRSGYGEPLLSIEDYKILDSFVLIDRNRLVQDSLNSIGTIGEGAQGKHVFAFAIGRYNSKMLDSLAKARCKFYMNTLRDSND